MPFVVDASISIAWVIGDEISPAAEAARQRLAWDDACAPSLWWFEVRNVILLSERRGRLTRQRADGALAYLHRQPVALDHAADETGLLHLARAHGLTAYDAAYLELAQRLGVPLASLDRALLTAARAIGVERVEPAK
jgi:predicted nucleic acid-binding protein